MAKEATSHAHKNAKLRDLVSCWSNLLPHRPRKECQICCEEKLVKAFGKTKQLPYDCRSHLRSICRRCVASSLSAQLDSKPLLAIGCPQCTAPWTRDDLMSLLASKDRKRYQRLDANAQRRAFIPAKHDMPERPTLDLLLESGARLCPWCQFPFIKDGGCDYMSCPKCDKGFALSYAFVLEDGQGRRAQDVADESVNDGEGPD